MQYSTIFATLALVATTLAAPANQTDPYTPASELGPNAVCRVQGCAQTCDDKKACGTNVDTISWASYTCIDVWNRKKDTRRHALSITGCQPVGVVQYERKRCKGKKIAKIILDNGCHEFNQDDSVGSILVKVD
jgi:hypothetical protein